MKKLLVTLSVAGLCTLPLSGMAAKYKEVSVSNGGSISGSVSFAGKDKAPKSYKISKDNDVCGTGSRDLDFVRVNNGKLMDTVVYLAKVKQGKAFDASLSHEHDTPLLQKGCEFKPFLQVMRNESKIAAENSDPVLHNIHTYEIIGRTRKTVFNVSQPDRGTVTKKVKLKRGVGMKIECDAHDFMHGFVFVAKNPYFSKVAEDGSYKIDQVPPGKYTLKVWHGTLKGASEKIEIAAGGSTTVDFTVKK